MERNAGAHDAHQRMKKNLFEKGLSLTLSKYNEKMCKKCDLQVKDM